MNDAAVLSAIVKARLKRKPKLDPVQYAQRFAIEKSLQERRYCEAFGLWKSCRLYICRRHRQCGGDAHICLHQALDRVPHQVQWQTRQDFLKAMPHNIGAPERAARQCMPGDFSE